MSIESCSKRGMDVRVLDAAACITGAVLVLACGSVCVHLPGTIDILTATLPHGFGAATVWAMLGGGVILILLLAFRETRSVGLLSALPVFGGFSAFSLLKLIREPNHACGCFPGLLGITPSIALALNLICMSCAFVGFCWSPSKFQFPTAPFMRFRVGAGDLDERIAMVVVCWVSSIAIGAVYFRFANIAPRGAGELNLRILSSKESDVLNSTLPRDFSGRATLIMFGDYECGPCRALYLQLKPLLRSYSGTIRFEFKNLPLTRIHPLAEIAAIEAEVARGEGKFIETHDRLYTTTLDENRISTETRELLAVPNGAHYRQAALDRIGYDRRLAQTLGVDETPTLFITNRSGGYELRDAGSLATVLRQFAFRPPEPFPN